MKCHILFSRKNKKNTVIFVKRMVYKRTKRPLIALDGSRHSALENLHLGAMMIKIGLKKSLVFYITAWTPPF